MKPSERRCQYIRSVADSQSDPETWHIIAVGSSQSLSQKILPFLQDIRADDHSVTVSQAGSAEQAREVLAVTPDIVLVILFLDGEKDQEWLSLIPWIRLDLGSERIRIAVCCLGPHGPDEKALFDHYDINDGITLSPNKLAPLEQMVKKALRNARSFLDLENKLDRKRQVERQLEEQKAALDDLIETIGDVVWETGRDHRFLYISANAKALYGYAGTALKGHPFDHAMDQDTRTGTWPEIERALADHRKFTNLEISRRHRDGSLRYFLTSGRPVFDSQGKWQGFRGADRDISALVHAELEKKKLIAQLRHAQRLEAMGTLAGGIAHDFNNILGGILGYTQLIQFEIKDNPVAMAHTDHIVAGCNRAKNLILQILDFSRQRESATPPKITLPGDIVTEAVKLLRASIPSSIRLETKIHEDAGPILADPSQIHQAVMNLCTNARQAIESGQGKILVAVSAVNLTPENHSRSPELDLDFGAYVTIAVTDTGKGIESNTLEKIFNPYFTTKKRGDGTGLGLSVVHGIVTRFSGIVTVSSSPGQGSTFTLYFPRHRATGASEKEHRIRLMEGKANVLFIDDEPMLVDIGRMMLEKLGYRVTALDTPLAGLNLIASEPDRFDIVITDMTMPDILGTQLADRIKQLNPDLPVVLATGFSNIVQTQKANPGGIDAVLPKPITMGSLSQTLYQLLNT